jgi:hypothetical protein
VFFSGGPARVAAACRRSDAMEEIQIIDYARQLFEAHGERAIAEAAQKASALERQGDRQQAETWRRIEAALKELRGPHAS